MRVGICDDDRIWTEKARELLEEYEKSAGLSMDFFCFSGRKELLEYQGSSFDVLFLDIKLEKDNGIETAQEINSRWKNCCIVYVTDYLNYATDVYRTVHAYFVLKEQFGERLGEIMKKVQHELSQKERKLIFSSGGRKLLLAPEEICYFERRGRTTYIRTKTETIEVPDKLPDIMKRLPAVDFVRCHNSYIVYLPAMKEMRREHFLLDSGEEILISRAYRKAVSEAFARWILTQIS